MSIGYNIIVVVCVSVCVRSAKLLPVQESDVVVKFFQQDNKFLLVSALV